MSLDKAYFPPIFALIVIALVVSVIDISEYKFVKSQRLASYQQGSDTVPFDYSIMKCLNDLFSKCSKLLFYICVYFVLKPLKAVAKSDIEFSFIFILARWIITIFPSNLIRIFLIDGRFNFNNLPISLFIAKELVTQLIIFILTIAFISLFRILARYFGKFSSNDVLIDFEESDSYNTAYDLSLSSRSHSTFQSDTKNPSIITIFNVTIALSVMISLFCYNWIETSYLNNSSILPDSKLMKSLLAIWNAHQIAYPGIKLHIESGVSNHLKIGFYGIMRRKVLISDNLVYALDYPQLNAILVNHYYRSNNQEGILIIISYLIQLSIVPYLINYITRKEITDRIRLGNFLSSVLPLIIIYSLPLHYLFNVVRFMIQKQMVFNSDMFSYNLGQPIADAIVRVSLLNKETTVHSRLYSLVNLPEPTLEERLVNLAISQSKHISNS